MGMYDDGGDLVKRDATQDSALGFDFQKSPVARKMAAVLADIDNLIHWSYPAQLSEIVNAPGDSVQRDSVFTGAGVADPAHFIHDYPAGTGVDERLGAQSDEDIFFILAVALIGIAFVVRHQRDSAIGVKLGDDRDHGPEFAAIQPDHVILV